MVKYFAILCGLFLNACVSTTIETADVEGKVESWLGMDQKTVQGLWGPPTEEVSVGQGSKVVQYQSQNEDGICTVVLTYNANGEVIGTKWTGEEQRCAGYVIASPSYSNSSFEETNMAILEAIENLESF